MNNLNLSAEDLANVTGRYNEISAAHDSALSLKENLVNAYINARPEDNDETAAEVVSKIIAGCEDLTRRYNEALADGLDINAEIESICKDMSVQDRLNFLINTLAVVETLNTSAFDEQSDIKTAVRNAIEQYSNANPEPTDADCVVMQNLLVDAIENNTIILSGAEKAKELLNQAAQSADHVIDFASEQFDDARVKAEMGLAMWLEYQDGNLSSLEAGAAPEAVGVGAATAVEQAKVLADVASGSTTVDIAVKSLKILGGIALVCLMGYFAIGGIAFIGTVVGMSLLSFFGTSAIACLASVILVLPLLWGLSNLAFNVGEYILDKAGKAFDVVVDALRDDIFPKVKEITCRFIAWIKAKLGGSASSDDVVIANA